MSAIEANVRTHVADMVLRAQGIIPEEVRAGVAAADQTIQTHSRALLTRAEHIADTFTPHLLAFRAMVGAAEEQGWDMDRPLAAILNRAREAHAALTGFDNNRPES